MYNFFATPANINIAHRMAARWESAQSILLNGYKFEDRAANVEGVDGVTASIAVLKPGSTIIADYYIHEISGKHFCGCPDFAKHNDFCKHTLAFEKLCADAEIEGMEQEQASLTPMMRRVAKPA